MGVSPWFRCLVLIPGFGRSGANREMKGSPKRLDCDFQRGFMFFLNRIVHIENIRLKPVANVGVLIQDLYLLNEISIREDTNGGRI